MSKKDLDKDSSEYLDSFEFDSDLFSDANSSYGTGSSTSSSEEPDIQIRGVRLSALNRFVRERNRGNYNIRFLTDPYFFSTDEIAKIIKKYPPLESSSKTKGGYRKTKRNKKKTKKTKRTKRTKKSKKCK
jgi:hypothetical protein